MDGADFLPTPTIKRTRLGKLMEHFEEIVISIQHVESCQRVYYQTLVHHKTKVSETLRSFGLATFFRTSNVLLTSEERESANLGY